MIKYLLYLLILSLFVLDWLFFRYGIGVRQMTWIPEFISIIIFISIPFRTAISKQPYVPAKYFFLIFIYLAHIFIGFLLNDVSGWIILSGLRIYTKFIPIFLLPLIFPFSGQDFKKLIILIFVLSMIQFPIVVWQRFVEYTHAISGDPMGGTLGAHASGVLSIFLLIMLAFLISLYFKEMISLPVFLLLFAFAFLPTTLNETKITFLLLPITIIIPALFIKRKRKPIIRIMLIAAILSCSFFILKGIYNYYQTPRWGYGIETFTAMPGRIEQYSRARLDPIKYSFANATKNLKFMFFGRGAGNVSEGFTPVLSGKYVKEGIYYGAKSVSFTKLMWEIGILGFILIFLFLFLNFWDSLSLCKRDGITGAFSLGMLSFTVFFFLAMFYTDVFGQNIFLYIYFLAAGHIAHIHAIEENIVADHTHPKSLLPI